MFLQIIRYSRIGYKEAPVIKEKKLNSNKIENIKNEEFFVKVNIFDFSFLINYLEK